MALWRHQSRAEFVRRAKRQARYLSPHAARLGRIVVDVDVPLPTVIAMAHGLGLSSDDACSESAVFDALGGTAPETLHELAAHLPATDGKPFTVPPGTPRALADPWLRAVLGTAILGGTRSGEVELEAWRRSESGVLVTGRTRGLPL